MPHVQSVAASSVVHVVARLPVEAPIVGSVVDAPEAHRRSQMIALRGVVIDHIQNYFETGAVQRPNHILEFSDLIACRPRRGAARIRRKESDRIVSPVISQSARK